MVSAAGIARWWWGLGRPNWRGDGPTQWLSSRGWAPTGREWQEVEPGLHARLVPGRDTLTEGVEAWLGTAQVETFRAARIAVTAALGRPPVIGSYGEGGWFRGAPTPWGCPYARWTHPTRGFEVELRTDGEGLILAVQPSSHGAGLVMRTAEYEESPLHRAYGFVDIDPAATLDAPVFYPASVYVRDLVDIQVGLNRYLKTLTATCTALDYDPYVLLTAGDDTQRVVITRDQIGLTTQGGQPDPKTQEYPMEWRVPHDAAAGARALEALAQRALPTYGIAVLSESDRGGRIFDLILERR